MKSNAMTALPQMIPDQFFLAILTFWDYVFQGLLLSIGSHHPLSIKLLLTCSARAKADAFGVLVPTLLAGIQSAEWHRSKYNKYGMLKQRKKVDDMLQETITSLTSYWNRSEHYPPTLSLLKVGIMQIFYARGRSSSIRLSAHKQCKLAISRPLWRRLHSSWICGSTPMSSKNALMVT